MITSTGASPEVAIIALSAAEVGTIVVESVVGRDLSGA